jgi:predicted transcriptional regulator
LLDGYRSPARHDTEVRELQEEIRGAHRDVVELEMQAESAAQDLARALVLLEKVRIVCADEATLNEVIALIEGIDLG